MSKQVKERINISVNLLEKAKNCIVNKNVKSHKSSVIVIACKFALAMVRYDKSYLYQYLNDENFLKNHKSLVLQTKDNVTMSVSFPKNLFYLFKKVYRCNGIISLSDAVTYAVTLLIKYKGKSPYSKPSELTNPALTIHGNKYSPNMRNTFKAIINPHINELTDVYDVFAGALGLSTAGVAPETTLHINDIDTEKHPDIKIVFYKTVQTHLWDMLTKLYDIKAFDNTEFDKQVNIMNDLTAPDIDRAVAYFCLNYFSYRGKNQNLKQNKNKQNKNKQMKNFRNRFCRLGELCYFLKSHKVKFTSKDWSYILNNRNTSNIHKKGNLILLDPPYMNSWGYSESEFPINCHKLMIGRVLNSSADFVYCARITGTRHIDKTNKTITNSEGELKDSDNHLRTHLKMFFNQKECIRPLYYVVIPYSQHKFSSILDCTDLGVTYEIMITSLEPDWLALNNLNNKHIAKNKKGEFKWGKFQP